jgi:hypothetical protein
MRISFDRYRCTVAGSCDAARPGPAWRSSDVPVSTAAVVIAVEPQQAGYLSHRDGAAAPVDRFS